MDIQKEREAFELNVSPVTWERIEYNAENNIYMAKSKYWTSTIVQAVANEIDFGWKMWQLAKAQVVPENKIEFDGEYIKYPNSYAIHCQFDEDFDCHIFDVYQNEDCVKDGMTQLKQAHLFVFSMMAAQEPAND